MRPESCRGSMGQEWPCADPGGALEAGGMGVESNPSGGVWERGSQRRAAGGLPAPMPLLPDAIYYPGTPPLSAVQHQAGAYHYRGAIASGPLRRHVKFNYGVVSTGTLDFVPARTVRPDGLAVHCVGLTCCRVVHGLCSRCRVLIPYVISERAGRSGTSSRLNRPLPAADSS